MHRSLQALGSVLLAGALALASPVQALADHGGGGGQGDAPQATAPPGCSTVQSAAQRHPGWLRAFPTLAMDLAACVQPGQLAQFGPGSRANGNGPRQFTDLGGYAWAQADISLLADLGILRGEGGDRFAPQGDLTRAQFAALLTRVFNLKPSANPPQFVDVPASFWAYGDIEAAAPYMSEFHTPGGVAFEPSLPELRIEVASTLGLVEVALNMASLPTTQAAAAVWARFKDGSQVPAGLAQSAAVAVDLGLMQGYPNGDFGVEDTLNRAQAAVLLARVLQSSETTIGGSPTPPPPVSGAPVVSSLSPTSGTPGTSVTITGSNFTSDANVIFGATAATSVTFVGADTLDAVAPAGSGTVNVLVTTAGGTSAVTTADQFSYTEAAPTVTGLSAQTGTAGDTVTITGTGFTAQSQVLFGATASPTVNYQSPTALQAVVPAGSGTVDVRVTTTAGTSTTSAADQFTYSSTQGAPTVTSLSAQTGTAGDTITIIGTGFTAQSHVLFGAVLSPVVTYQNSAALTAVVPTGSGQVDVRVTTSSGTSATSSADLFTYTSTGPVVTSVDPTSAAAGTAVLIQGTGFASGDIIFFGGVQATSVQVYNSETVTAIVPAGSGTVTVSAAVYGGVPSSSGPSFTYN